MAAANADRTRQPWPSPRCSGPCSCRRSAGSNAVARRKAATTTTARVLVAWDEAAEAFTVGGGAPEATGDLPGVRDPGGHGDARTPRRRCEHWPTTPRPPSSQVIRCPTRSPSGRSARRLRSRRRWMSPRRSDERSWAASTRGRSASGAASSGARSGTLHSGLRPVSAGPAGRGGGSGLVALEPVAHALAHIAEAHRAPPRARIDFVICSMPARPSLRALRSMNIRATSMIRHADEGQQEVHRGG